MAISKKSSLGKMNVTKSTYKYDMTTEFNIFYIILNSFVVYYLLNLEEKSCNCIRDWRHNYIKYLSIFSIILNMLSLFEFKTIIKNKHIITIICILGIVNIYAFYTYIRDLNDTKCECAVSKQKNLHNFLNVWRYIMVFLPIFAIILVLIIFFIFMNFMNQKAL